MKRREEIKIRSKLKRPSSVCCNWVKHQRKEMAQHGNKHGKTDNDEHGLAVVFLSQQTIQLSHTHSHRGRATLEVGMFRVVWL